MTTERILQSDVLDIIFEGRNKEYGAYDLRKRYELRMRKALTGTFLVVALLGSIVLLANRKQAGSVFNIEGPDTHLTEVQMNKPVQQPQEQPVQRHQAKTVDHQPVVVVPDQQVPKTEVPTDDEIAHAVISNEKHDGDDVDENENLKGQHGDPDTGVNTGVPQKDPEPELPQIFETAERMPEFPGGRDALMRFLQRNISQPELEDGETVSVRVQFVVNETGDLTDVHIIQSGGNELDELVLRAIRKMPRWTPGEQNGRNVAVRFVQSVSFQGGS